jgi:alanine racemase
MSRALAEVDLDAVAHNVRELRRHVGGGLLCAVVKANAYGHGAVPVADAALRAGADWLAVAHAAEGVELRRAGVCAPILLLSEPLADEVDAAVDADLRVAVYTAAGVERLAAAGARLRVHLKVNTGMNRVGAAPDEVVGLARRLAATRLDVEALWTHCAVADEPDNPFTGEQLGRFEAAWSALADAGLQPPLRHAANSAAAIAHPASRYDLVRVGIALYGVPPSAALAGRVDLRPAMTVRSEVAQLKRVGAGEAVSYGLHHRFATDTVVATVPMGYADGIPRRWGLVGGRALVGGVPRPVVGAVTMDQLMLDCGDGADVAVGDEVVLLGRQGRAELTAEDLATPLGTIGYEILTGIGPRVPRAHRRAETGRGPGARASGAAVRSAAPGGGGTRRPG